MNAILIKLVPVLAEGFSMMLVGMGTVLIFLCIMIVAMHIMSAAVKKINEIFPEQVTVPTGNAKKTTKTDDSEIAVAIAAAIFRK